MEQVIWFPGMKFDELEKAVILSCLEFTRGNKTKAAEALGITPRTIDNKLAIYKEQDDAWEKRKAIIEKQKAEWRERGKPKFAANGDAIPTQAPTGPLTFEGLDKPRQRESV